MQDSFRRLYAEGVAADSTDAMDAAETHRQHIERWFYQCPPPLHRGLGDLFGSDPKFSSMLPAPDAAEWIRSAFYANADRLTAD